MQVEGGQGSLDEVRCLACHAVYEPPLAAGAPAETGCPECGALVWLAATIPPAESDLGNEP